MKLALIALPVVALTTMSVAQAQILSITNAGKTSQVIVREDDGEDYYLPSDAVNAAIKNLSQQTQQKEDRLASLAQKLSTQPTTTIINMPTTGSYAGNGMLALRPITSSARMSSGFGYRIHPVTGKSQFHKGMDFAAPIGTPIYATGNGVVTFSGWGTGYGRYVEVDHGNGTVTRYAHTSANYVNVGDTVYANQQIAAVGNTGRSTGAHLHYEVRQNGQAVNPQTYLAMAPAR
ncbi:M23 family metallopeptidase [Moraxella sp. K23]|jgi:murein DD-endopeptidase MepM/ murein hydrolase activator NlpD|nr:peptidase M23 [Enhydrobacter sp. H5]